MMSNSRKGSLPRIFTPEVGMSRRESIDKKERFSGNPKEFLEEEKR